MQRRQDRTYPSSVASRTIRVAAWLGILALAFVLVELNIQIYFRVVLDWLLGMELHIARFADGNGYRGTLHDPEITLWHGQVSHTRQAITSRGVSNCTITDEFCLLLPETDGESVPRILHKLKMSLDEAMFAMHWPVSFSIGAITTNTAAVSSDVLIHEADKMMYRAKQSGKNRFEYDTLK